MHTASSKSDLPSALEAATFAVTLLENDPLFNSGHGAVFTRDGINELEASVMVSRGFKKRGVGVIGLQRVKNPILLARAILEHGEQDLGGNHRHVLEGSATPTEYDPNNPDAPSAQGHTLIHGRTAESLAKQYGLEMVEPSYYFTQPRWDEHIRALEREKAGKSKVATWDSEEYLPQGTCGAVALDSDGVVCCATSTGGLTNKLTGRIGDTPAIGAGYWAEEWTEEGDPTRRTGQKSAWEMGMDYIRQTGPIVEFGASLRSIMADCLPTPFMYTPIQQASQSKLTTTRSVAVSGTGNGDSFLRVNAARTVAAIARWKPESSAVALSDVTGPGGELQKSAGDRWGNTGEGEGGIIGIEATIVRNAHGDVVEVRGDILDDHNCGGLIRAWIDDKGKAVFKLFRDDTESNRQRFIGHGQPEEISDWVSEK